MGRSSDGGGLMSGLGRKWVIVLVVAVAGGALGYVSSRQIPPIYQATTTLLVGDISNAPHLTKDDVETSGLLASTYAALIRNQPVLQGVVEDLDLRLSWQELKDDVHAFLGPNGTPVIIVTVRSGSPSQASRIADAVADQVVALSPASIGGPGTDDARAFAAGQAAQLENAIRREEGRVARLETARASASSGEARADLESRIRTSVKLITELQGNFRSIVGVLAVQGSPNTLQVVGPVETSPIPSRPNATVNMLLGAAVGALTGLGIAFGALRGRGARRKASGGASAQVAGASDRIASMGEASGVRAPDPWIQELVDIRHEP